MKPIVTDEWELFEKSKDYKRNIGLYATVDKNWRFYEGDQWNGVVSNGLPTPVFNIFKRCINYFVSAIMSQAVKVQFVPYNISSDSEDVQEQYMAAAFDMLSKHSEVLWERLKMDSNLRSALLDAAISGDMCGYVYFDPTIRTGQIVGGVEIMGDISFEMVDDTNIHFGNPNDSRIEKQPWIILQMRSIVKDIKAEAKRNKIKVSEISLIASDSDYNEQAGDSGKKELELNDDNGKATVIVKFWRNPDTDTIWYNKSTKDVKFVPDTDMEIKRYPIAHNSWDKKKNSCHGRAVGTGLVPNQIYINKMFAMVMKNLMDTAFPKAIVNANLVDNWRNEVGQTVYVNSAEDVSKVAQYLQGAPMSSQIMATIDAAIQYTKEFIGATDAGLGQVSPENTSAIIALQQASVIPLETVKANLYQWVEDIGYIWLDFMIAKYGERNIMVMEKGQRRVVPFNFNDIKNIRCMVKIDVGPSSYWSEITAIQTLDNLLNSAKIDFIQYLERLPDGVIPKKDDLIMEVKEAMANPPEPKIPPPSVSISFADLPMNAQIQLAKQLGIELTPQDFAMIPNEEQGQEIPPEQMGQVV